jgi:RNA polymerase sigma factor (sigma-70 family)
MSEWKLDEQLLEQWRAGDAAAGKRLVDRHLDTIARFFRNKVTSGFDDLVQQTFLALVEGRDRIRAGSTVRAYLLSTAHNVLCTHLRKLARGRVVDLSVTRIVELAPGPSTVAAQRSEQRLLLAGLRELPIEHQVALELAYWEGLNAAEIAEIMGISHSAMRSRLSRARKLLGEILERLADSPQLLEQTMTELDQWATKLRDQLS